MRLKAKWLVQEHYLTILVCLSGLTVFLAVGLYFVGADWKALLGILGTLISFVFVIQRQQLEETKLIKELITDFNRRYDDLNERLNAIIEPEKADRELDDCEISTLNDYFNLCGEEFLFYRKGYIYPEVWDAWAKGAKPFFTCKKIRRLWDQESEPDSYYGFSMEQLRRRSS